MSSTLEAVGMKCIVNRSQLVSLISVAQRIVPAKAILPILSNVLIEAGDGMITLSATDLNVSLQASMPAQVEVAGAITLPARRFFQLIRELSTPMIEITVEGNVAHIRAGSSLFKVNGIDKGEFPPIPTQMTGLTVDVKSDDLREMLIRTSFAAAREEVGKPACVSVLMKIEKKSATFVATDGKRLARFQKPIEIDQDITAVVPLKAVQEMIDLLSFDETATLSFLDGKILLKVGPVCLIAKLIGLPYPDYARAFVDQSELTMINIHKEEWVALLRQIALFTSESSHSARFTFKDGMMRIRAQSPEYGEGEVEMAVDVAKELDIAFNPQYVMEALKHCKGDVVRLGLCHPYMPGLILDPASVGVDFVVMPMRLKEDD
ncbi:MAG: DNA polymerase III subunit beta [Chlamydiia bacterium]